jgi:hypothetical protein
VNRLGGLGPTPTDGEVDDERDMRAQDAVTLRDAFAMRAMEALVGDPALVNLRGMESTIAYSAYVMADAMLKARRQ